MSKNLRYFMREEARTEQIITVPGPESIKDENGKVVQLKIKVLPTARIREINEKYTNRSIAFDKKGNPYVNRGSVVFCEESDFAKATRHIIVEALVEPDLKDPELMEFFKCVDITQMPEKVFYRTSEYSHVSKAVMAALGIGDGVPGASQSEADKADLEDAKN